MKQPISALVLIISLGYYQMYGQQDSLQLTSRDSIIVSSWMVGVGTNIVDDSGDAFNDFTTIKDQWNMVPFPSRLNIGRYFRSGLGLEAIATYNRYKEGNIIDGAVNPEDTDYFALDARLSYDLNKIVGETGWFDPYVGGGIGYTEANNLGRGTYNAVLGFRTWFSDHWGLDLNTSGKWSFGNEATNHIQHAAAVLYRFNIEKELSKKGREKLALIQEQERIADSLAAVQKAEEEAHERAERLEKEREEAARRAAEEKARQEAEAQRRTELQQAVDNMGKPYFEFNSSYLTASSEQMLEKLATFLNEHESLILKISGHTDSRGSSSYNQWLSERRANRIEAFLRDRGVGEGRLETAALGETELTNECRDGIHCTEEKHGKNRRVEFLIIRF